MPKLISEKNGGGGEIGISSDGQDVGKAKRLDFYANRIEINSGIATISSDPLTLIDL
jgi:hypothetical protein